MFDDDDLKIIEAFLKLRPDECKTGWGVMKSIFRNGKDTEHSHIRRKIIAMSKVGLFKITKNSPTTFLLDTDKVFRKRISIGTRKINCLCLLTDGKYQIFEL